MTDGLLTGVHLRTSDGPSIADGAIAWQDGEIVWLGPAAELPQAWRGLPSPWRPTSPCWVTPGFIDCHTHLVYAGDRADEFEARALGESYADIALRGGGILATVRAVRAATAEQLVQASLPRLRGLQADGVTTVEIKSGYGLERGAEATMLRAARALAGHDVEVVTTFLGAHATPPGYTPDAWVDEVVAMLPGLHAAGLVDAVDAFCETIGFTPAQTTRVFAAARALGLPVKLHAEQLSDQGGAALVARHAGLSADHLEHLSPEGVTAMATAGTVAVLLPGAFYWLRETRAPPIQALRDAGVPMAVATDCNPGTSPLASLRVAMNMACLLFRLTPDEALDGVTCHAARALGLTDRGLLRAGRRADLAVWEVDRPVQICHAIGPSPLRARVLGGRWLPAPGA